MIVFILEPEGAWRCNECGEWSGPPEEHAAAVHKLYDRSEIMLVDTDDI